MVLWFIGVGVVLVWVVFRSPALDYRMVILGVLLPIGEAGLGGPRVLHTLLACVVVLCVVMALTQRRRLIRRRWLGLPIGLFLHLVLDGTWQHKQMFWWPLFGSGFAHGQVPELTHGAVGWLLEAVGAVAIVWLVERFRLREPERRARFVRTGQFSRDLARGPEAGC